MSKTQDRYAVRDGECDCDRYLKDGSHFLGCPERTMADE